MINRNFDGIHVVLDPASVQTGGQGRVLFGYIDGDPNMRVVVKILPDKPSIRQRLELLCEGGYGETIPHLSAPLKWHLWPEENGLAYLTTYSAGAAANCDVARSFDERLALLARAAALWRLMGTSGLVHCDISFNNVLVRPDGFIDIIDVDNCVVSGEPSLHPEKAGQIIMMAPEIRKHMNTDIVVHPDEFSDRFSWAILFNQLLLQRHPLDGVAKSPAHRDQLLAHGDWLELQRTETERQIPHRAVGKELTECFRKGFSLIPERRTTAQEWLGATENTLQHLYRHSCGGIFVCDEDRGTCPYCGEVYERKMPVSRVTLTQLSSGRSAEFPLFENEPLIIGRANASFVGLGVSRQQFQISFSAGRLKITNIGRNPIVGVDGLTAVTATDIYDQSWGPGRTLNKHYEIAEARLSIRIH